MSDLNTLAGRIRAVVGEDIKIDELRKMINDKHGENIISKGTVSTALSYNTKVYNFTTKNLIALAKTLNVSVDYLLGLSQNQEASEYSSLGLTKKSADVLKELMDTEKNHAHHQNTFKISNAKKKLDIINWILEHEADSNDNFLLSLYNYVMCGFDSYRGTVMDIFVEGAKRNIDEELNEYINAVREYQVISSDDYVDSIVAPANRNLILDRLAESRSNYIKYQSFNQDLYEDLDFYDKNRCVFVSDPNTVDELALTLPSPSKLIQMTIEDTLDKWQKEYEPIYQSRVKQFYERYTIKEKDLPSAEEYYSSIDADDDDYILDEEIMYRPSETYSFTEEEMCKYLLCEFLEDTPLLLRRIKRSNELIFYRYDDVPEEYINKILQASEELGIGFVRKDDKFYFDINKTIPSKIRLKERFERYNLPSYFKIWFKSPFFSHIMRPDFIEDFSDEEYEKIMNKASKAKLKYKITRNQTIEIYNDESLARNRKANDRLLEQIEALK